MAAAHHLPAELRQAWTDLEEERRQLLEELDRYGEEELNRQPEAGRWSVMQVLHHVKETERLTHAYLQKKLRDPGALQAASWRTYLRQQLLWLLLRLPLKAKAPEAVSGDKLPAHSRLAEIDRSWTEERLQFRTFLEQQPPDVYGTEAFRHPIVGRLSLAGMVKFLRDHFRRHRKQVYRTLEAVQEL